MSQSTHPTDVTPACSTGAVEAYDWREIPYTQPLLEFYRPCKCPSCYPEGAPAPEEVETVVRSTKYPTSFHRLGGFIEGDAEDEDENMSTFTDDEIAARESLTDITDLRIGDGVMWFDEQTPLVAVETTPDPSGTVVLEGPGGGEYTLSSRQNGSFIVYPGYGRVEVERVVPE